MLVKMLLDLRPGLLLGYKFPKFASVELIIHTEDADYAITAATLLLSPLTGTDVVQDFSDISYS